MTKYMINNKLLLWRIGVFAIAYLFASVSHADQVDRLIEQLQKGDNEKKAFAASALSKIQDDRAIPPLIKSLNNKNSYLRSYFMQALESFGEAAVPSLIEACSSDKTRTRGNAANTLGRIGDKRALDTILFLLNDKKKFVRKNVLIALNRFHDEKIMNALVSRLKVEKNASLRSYVVNTLGEYQSKEIIQPLVNSTKDKDAFVRKDSVRALGKLGFIEITAPVIVTLADPDEEIQDISADILVEMGRKNDNSFRLLIEATKHEKPIIRSHIAKILGKTENKEAVPAIIDMLNRKDEADRVKLAAVESLGDLKDPRGIDPIIAQLESFYDPIRLSAVESLGKIGDIRAIEPLIPVMRDYDEMVRTRAIVVLGDFGDERALKGLQQITQKDQKERIRKLAKETYKRIQKSKTADKK